MGSSYYSMVWYRRWSNNILIAFSGFPIILNTIQGVRAISKDYYNAARSMGASPIVIFTNVIVPASLPDILTGSRIAISTGWMSVI